MTNRERLQCVHLNTKQLAERWGTSPAKLANDRSLGRGPAYLRIGSKILYPVAGVEAYERDCSVSTLDQGVA
jgi:hypothetical protein